MEKDTVIVEYDELLLSKDPAIKKLLSADGNMKKA